MHRKGCQYCPSLFPTLLSPAPKEVKLLPPRPLHRSHPQHKRCYFPRALSGHRHPRPPMAPPSSHPPGLSPRGSPMCPCPSGLPEASLSSPPTTVQGDSLSCHDGRPPPSTAAPQACTSSSRRGQTEHIQKTRPSSSTSSSSPPPVPPGTPHARIPGIILEPLLPSPLSSQSPRPDYSTSSPSL